MKRFALLGVILAAGLGYGLYQMTQSSSPPSSSSSAATPGGSAAPKPPAPRPTEPPVQDSTTTRTDSAAVADETAPTATANTSASAPHSGRGFKERTRVGSGADDSPEAVQRDMNLRVQRAACQAPGIEQRYRSLDAAGRAKLEARCREAGVVLADPK